ASSSRWIRAVCSDSSLRASEAKQSRLTRRRLDCFVASLLAMTLRHDFPFSRHDFVRGIQFRLRLFKKEGAGMTVCALNPRSHVRCASKNNAAHEHTGSAETLRP